MAPDVFSVSPTDNLQTILQKLDTAIQSLDATIQSATARRDELMTMRSSLERLPTEAPSTEPQPQTTTATNGAEPNPPASKEPGAKTTPAKTTPASKSPASKATNEPESNGSAASEPTAAEAESRTPPKRRGLKETGTAAKPSTSGSKSPKSKSAAKTTANNTASVKGFDLGQYQESVQESASITHGMPLQDALVKLLASLPDQSFTTHEVVRRLYGVLKPEVHAEVMPQVQSALSTGIRRHLWSPAGSKKQPKYRHLSV